MVKVGCGCWEAKADLQTRAPGPVGCIPQRKASQAPFRKVSFDLRIRIWALADGSEPCLRAHRPMLESR